MSKIYLVKAIECGVSAEDAFDHYEGYTTSLEEAEAICKRLKSENAVSNDFWNKYGCNCNVEFGSWPDSNISVARTALEKERKCNKCPYADLSLRNICYDNGDKLGRVEISCKNRTDKCQCLTCTTYEYIIEEVEKL